MTRSVENILPREIDSQLDSILSDFSMLIEEFVNFGTHVLMWNTENINGSDEQMPPMMFFRDLLEKADSISIIVKKSSIDPAKVILRSIFETHLYLDYITEKETVDRAMSFLVWETKKKIQLLDTYNDNTNLNNALKSKLRKDKSLDENGILDGIPNLNSEIENLEELLRQEEYQNANEEYHRIKKLDNRKPNWYRLFDGPKNIQQLADYLNMGFMYEVLYRHWSGSVHGTDITYGKIAPSNYDDNNSEKIQADIIQIRLPKDAQQVSGFTLILLLKTIRILIERRIPNKKDEFNIWYKSVKDSFSKVTSKESFIKIE